MNAARRLASGAVMAVLFAAAGSAMAAAAGVPATPNDPGFSRQWGLAKIGAPAAWSRATGAGIKIGIVDSGVDLSHEDLAGKVVAHADCVGAAGDPAKCKVGGDAGQDDNGHGSHVSGIAAATTNNGKGGAGVAPEAQLIMAKALSRKDNPPPFPPDEQGSSD